MPINIGKAAWAATEVRSNSVQRQMDIIIYYKK